MVQTSSVLFVATAAIYAASPVVGAGLPLAALGKDLLKAAEGHHSTHPTEHAAISASKKLIHEQAGQAGTGYQFHPDKTKPVHEKVPALKPVVKGAKHELAHEHEKARPGSKLAVKGAKHELGHEHEAHPHTASRRPAGPHDAQRNGKEHRLGAQEHGHLHESNRYETGKGRPGSQKNRLSEHEHGHERLGGQRRPGEQGHLTHERLSRPESNRPGREGRLGHEHEHVEAGSRSRIQSQHGRPEAGRLAHERLAHPETGRPHVGAPSSRLSSRPSASRPYNNQAAIKKEIDDLYRLEGRDWDEDLYVRDFVDLEDLYARGDEDRQGRHRQAKHGHKHRKNSHHQHQHKQHQHKQKGAMLATQEAAGGQPEAGPVDPSQGAEMGARGWYDDDLLEFAQRSFYDFYDELD